MKSLLWTAALCAVLVFFSSGLCQDEVMVLESEELAPRERFPVTFPHERHAELMECLRCHHDYDAYGTNVGSEGQRCSDCHDREGDGNPVPLVRAFHSQCKSCHQKVGSGGKGTPLPVMCGQCHVK